MLETLRAFSKIPRPDFAQTFCLVRNFQSLLAEAKEEIGDINEAAMKTEEKHYKQTSDVSHSWLEEREDYFKALTEARYRNERTALIETIEQWWADVLRQQQSAAHLDHPDFSADTATLANQISTSQVLRRADAIAGLRENFSRNVNEPLAIEVAFLDAFAA